MSGIWETAEQILRLDLNSLYEFSPLAIFLILFFTTFITEDGACLAAGALAGQGRISFALGLFACFAGILVGDLGLYWIGRLFGEPFSKTRVFRRLVSERQLAKASLWLERRGPMAIVISRFVSGLRLPTYLAAGFLRADFSKFAFYFLVATAIWTPLLVGSATFAQQIISPQYLLLSIISLFVIFRLLFNLSTWRKRRLLIGRLKRIRYWEFWSYRIFYFPVIFYILWLGLKHRSLNVFTCSNPGILASGFVGESKHLIYQKLEKSKAAKPFLLEHEFISKKLSVNECSLRVLRFLEENRIDYPVIVKPNVGERGKDVLIANNEGRLGYIFDRIKGDRIVQEYAPGDEVSIFYYRYPSQKRGKIFSITEKDFPKVVGDGVTMLENLILRDQRAVSLAKKYFDQNISRLEDIPKKGEIVQIIDIGTHSQGAIFKEGDWLMTDQLERKIDEICKEIDGFYFGRFDIRTRSFGSLKDGEGFKIIELNGVTSESTNIYDRRYSLIDAYRILFKQWRIAFEIGEENRSRGAKPTSVADLVRLIFNLPVNGSEN